MEQEIQELGLNEKEAKIYIQLIKEKSATASKIAKLTKINRTTAYLELENLMKKGLASYVIKNSKRYYHPANPKKLIEILETKKKKINSIMPQLQNLHQDQEPFKIEVYEGKQGLKTFYQDIINNTGEILAFGVTGMAFEILNFEFPHIVKQGIKNKIKIRYLANKDSKKQLNKIPKQILKVKYLSEKYNAKVSTIIYSNKVAIQSLQKDRIYISVIKDKNLYESYKNYFEFMWNSAN